MPTATIIGSGPNGLSAAIVLAAAGVSTTIFERNLQIGGACSTAETTLPNFRQDLGSSVCPLGIASPAGLFCAAALKLSLMPSLAIWKILAAALKSIMRSHNSQKLTSFSPTSLPDNFFASQALNCPRIIAGDWNVSVMAPSVTSLTRL